MNTENTLQNSLEDIKVNVKLKLATLWAGFMLNVYGIFQSSLLPSIINGFTCHIELGTEASPAFF